MSKEYESKVSFDDCFIKHITPKGGVLVFIPELEDEFPDGVWFFQDMLDEDSEIWNTKGEVGRLVIREYVAAKKGLI